MGKTGLAAGTKVRIGYKESGGSRSVFGSYEIVEDGNDFLRVKNSMNVQALINHAKIFRITILEEPMKPEMAKFG